MLTKLESKLLHALEAAQEWLNDMSCEHEEGNEAPDCVVCIVNKAVDEAHIQEVE